jgi:hypothetical protein
MILREIEPATLGIESCMGFRASIDVFEKRKISCPCCESYPQNFQPRA